MLAMKPSEGYRFGLSQELRALREKDKEAARSRLSAEKQTHSYRLSEVLHRNKKQEQTNFDKREFDEKTPPEDLEIVTVSNEPSLFETFEYIKNISGAGLGVGFDQMLDVAVNTNLEHIFITDINPPNLLATRGLLEVGRRFHVLYGRYPSPQEYTAFFEEKNLPLTLEMIGSEFTRKEKIVIEKTYKKSFYYDSSLVYHSDPIKGPLAVQHYLSYKAGQSDYNSWLSSSQNLEKIIRMYEEQHLKVIRADLAGPKSLSLLGDHLNKKGVPISFLYLSNTLEFFLLYGNHITQKMGHIEGFFDNLGALPVTDQTILVHTGQYASKAVVPVSATNDQYLNQHFHPWSHVVQSMRSFKEFSYNTGNIRNLCAVLRSGLEILRKRGRAKLSKPGVYVVDVPLTEK